MIEWWGPIIYEYYAGTEGNGFTLITPDEWLAHPGSVGRAVLGEAPHPRRRRHGAARRRGRARSTSRAAAPSSTTTTPRRRAERAHRQGWSHARRHRLRRRRRLPLPHRPQGLHDHLGRRQHLPAGGRERPRRRTRRSPTSPCSASRTTDFGEEVKAVVQPVDMADAGPDARARADRVLPRAARAATSARARSTSTPSCRATRPASSTSACSATATGATRSRIV